MMSNMKKLTQRGAINILLIPFVLVVLFFFGSLGFGFWAFSQRNHYKDHSDQEVAAAVAAAIQQQKQSDAADYAQQAKKPYNTYIGPAAFGNITVNYPKTWSSYVIESDSGGNPISGYFMPNTVPNVTDPNNSYALRIELVQTSYDTVVSQFQSALQIGKVTVQPYTLPKVPSVVGSRIEGQITPTKQGTMIVLPLRNMTLKIWTESNDFKGDLDTAVLPNFSFVP
jgi:Flp pilus assembly protein TadG